MKTITTTTLYRRFFALMLLFVGLSISCQKDGNPNNLPAAHSPSYEGRKEDGVIRILAVGNSFSEDALESHLFELAAEKGIKVVIGNLFIGGASLALHHSNMINNASIYDFRKINSEGIKKNFPKTSLAVALADEYWDYISFQEVSQFSGQRTTIEASLPALIQEASAKGANPNLQIIFHQTWAYAQNSTHEGFKNYNNSQQDMYQAIVQTSQYIQSLPGVHKIIPAGTAIQNARSSALEDNLTRDGYHLAMPVGRYTAACVWFESLFGISPVGMLYKPEGLSTFEAQIAQNAAHLALQRPFEQTAMTEFQGGNSGPLTQPVLIDFGNNASSPGWNQVSSFLAGTSINMKDSVGSYVGIKLLITERFNGVNTDGPPSSSTLLNMPSTVSRYSYFGNTKALFNNLLIPQSSFVISGLDKSLSYSITFFGARGAVSDNRETKYTAVGTNEVSASLNTSSNVDKTATVARVFPDENGNITVKVTAGENNNNGSGFYYWSVARLVSNN